MLHPPPDMDHRRCGRAVAVDSALVSRMGWPETRRVQWGRRQEEYGNVNSPPGLGYCLHVRLPWKFTYSSSAVASHVFNIGVLATKRDHLHQSSIPKKAQEEL